MAEIWRQQGGGPVEHVATDRPLVERRSAGLELQVFAPGAVWIIKLSNDDAERIADAIGRERPGAWPGGNED
jgi:hypothetical protein